MTSPFSRHALDSRKARRRASGDPAADPGTGTSEGGSRRWCCRQCGAPVTPTDAALTVDGAHRHTFANPGGFVFRIRMFHRAPGTLGVGRHSEEFSWFPGHLWQVSVCRVCTLHLGWRFRSSAPLESRPPVFYGLIEDRLVLESPSPDVDGDRP